MNLRKSFFALVLAPALALAADVAYSPPVGGMTIAVPAGQTRSVALPLLHDSIGSGAVVGRITGIGSNFLDVSDANWTTGSFSGAANPYYVRIKSGSAVGRTMLVTTTSNTSSRLFLNADGIDLTVAGGLTVGDTYEIVLADTLNTFFGSTTLQGGADAGSADNVLLWGGASWQTYYFNTVRNRWELRGLTSISANNVVLRPDRGMMITRRASTELTMRVVGRVPDKTPRYFHSRPGVTFLSAGIPVSQTLGQLSLQTRVAGWVNGTSIANADSVQVWGGASWQTYYFDSTNNRWQLQGLTTVSANNVNLTGRPMMIKRLNTATASESLIEMPLPYAIN